MIEYSERNKEIERQVYRDNNKRHVRYKQGERKRQAKIESERETRRQRDKYIETTTRDMSDINKEKE